MSARPSGIRVPIIIIPRDAAYIGRSPLATTFGCRDAAYMFISAGSALGAGGGPGGGGAGGGPFYPGNAEIPPNIPRLVQYPPPPVPPPTPPCCVTSPFFTIGGMPAGPFAALNGLKAPLFKAIPVCPVPGFTPQIWLGNPALFPAFYLTGESAALILTGPLGTSSIEFTLLNSRLVPPAGGFTIYSPYTLAGGACIPYGATLPSTGFFPTSFVVPSAT